MQHEIALKAWESFYVIVGTSAAALTGLQFVVMTLIGESSAVRSRADSISAFGTPNVVHFCAALLLSSLLSAPWGSLSHAGVSVAVSGALGVVYSILVWGRARRQRGYEPVFEDWLWHTVLPVLSYVAMLVTGIVLERTAPAGLFVIGGAVLLLVFIGIHNSWDTVTYVTLQSDARPRAQDAHTKPAPGAAATPPPASATPPAPAGD